MSNSSYTSFVFLSRGLLSNSWNKRDGTILGEERISFAIFQDVKCEVDKEIRKLPVEVLVGLGKVLIITIIDNFCRGN